jgi:Spy/CpxP family protein refolding chaperone
MRVPLLLILPVLVFTATPVARAQHVHPSSPAAPAANATTSLTAEQVQQLLNGEGMGLAKPAELNRYPGPKHVLDRAVELGLTAEQVRQVTDIRQRMLTDAKPLGRRIVDAERDLDTAFASGSLTASALTERLAGIASLNGRLRTVHLGAHLSMKAVLTPAQVDAYYATRR